MATARTARPRCSRSPRSYCFCPRPLKLRRATTALALAITCLALFAAALSAPPPLNAQQDSAASLEDGDRVRVWSPRHEFSGELFYFRGWQAGSLLLVKPNSATVWSVSPSHVQRLRVRTGGGGSHFWEGTLIGGGVGLVTAGVLGGVLCGEGGDYQGGLSCALKYGLLIFSRVTVPSGALLGGLIGWAIPDYDWATVQLGPAAARTSVDGATRPGLAVRVEFRLPQ